MNRIETSRKYYNELKVHDGTKPYNTSIASCAADALTDSDYYANLQDNTPEALFGRYEFRDGAACMLASVFGLDMDYAREIMRTRAAWTDYQEAMKCTAQ